MKLKQFSIISGLFLILFLAACSSPTSQPNGAADAQPQTAPALNAAPATSGEQAAPASNSGQAVAGETAVLSEGETAVSNQPTSLTYPIVDTDQTNCFSDAGAITCGTAFNGQDAQYEGLQPAYQDNGDGTVTDLNTGLMWIQDPGEKTFYADAMKKLETFTYAGYDDWRLPTIKELYSLALFSGIDASAAGSSSADGLVPFMDTDYFVFRYGDESGGARVIDAQWLTSTIYNSTVMDGQSCFFGFNFSDGRIKCYPLELRGGGSGGYFAMFVRGGSGYGENNYVNNNNGTITDNATGLTWTQNDNGDGVLWDDALNYCESLSLGGSDKWRLPNIKELQSIVDYNRSPDATNSPAIDPLFNLTTITNEAGQTDYPFYWSSTTLISYPNRVSTATYISFGEALGYMENFGGWIDVHGAGAQRSDPKTGVSNDQQFGGGPQGDARRSDNYVLCVSGGSAGSSNGSDASTLNLPEGNQSAPQGAPAGEGNSNQTGGPGNNQGQPTAGQGGPLADAAAQLGVSEEALQAALGEPGQGPPDLEAAAQQLGVTVEALQAALGTPAQQRP